MASGISGPTRSSTAQTTATQSLDGVVLMCRDGGTSSDPQAGMVTIRVIDPTTVVNRTEYFVEDSTHGGVILTLSSPGAHGTGVVYGGSVTEESRMDPFTVVTVTRLDYSVTHTVIVTATSSQCSGLVVTTPFNVSFNIAALSFNQPPTASIVCANPSLPIQLVWSTTQNTHDQSTTDPATPLTPPVIGQPVISYTTSSGGMGSVSSSSPYTLPNPTVGDVYTFTVSVSNAAGVTSNTSPPVGAFTFEVYVNTTHLTVTINEDCNEDVASRVFQVHAQIGFGDCLMASDLTTTKQVLSTPSYQVPLNNGDPSELCYQVTLLHQGTVVGSKTSLNFAECRVSDLESFVGLGVTYQLDGAVNKGNVSHLTTASLSCPSAAEELRGAPRTTCINGLWDSSERRSCSVAPWLPVMIILILAFVIGIVCGAFLGRYYMKYLLNKKLWAIIVIFLVLLFGVGIGILFYYCCCRCHGIKKPAGTCTCKGAEKLTECSPPSPDSLYADPKTIEHQATACGNEYTLLPLKKSENKTQEATLNQDPSTIEHETAPSGEMYAVVDKPKRGSKKKEPDVVSSQGAEKPTDADIDVSGAPGARCKPKPAAPCRNQDQGHVEYAVVIAL